ncbi:TcpE family conjugal transfer membrane protein [Clostridium perfringens]|uniref:TcpE family conjugal transfer membrane protein n=1 Tax=Clostridium perfringens TaxID=1502 RepID=UPI0024BD3537|nr:TcpE family conjugal transfer membrane protein [Clostridium perfringens]ELC8333337.1 conjugal transfer protein [Clostridium perfringens]MDK0554457.1 TcpE family conjugal transfer membrane protein [Clostridium perfringens]
MEEERKILRSYNKLKNFEIKIYRLGNTTIPFPLPITTTVYFLAALTLVAIIDATIGIHINFIYKYVALPLGIAYIAKNKKIDGKPMHKYLLRLIQFQNIKKSKIERFEIRENLESFRFIEKF